MTVFMVTWCRSIESLYGNCLTFETLRIGFPSARVVVIDNCSAPECRDHIRKRAEAVGAEFVQLESEAPHYALIENIISRESGPVCFVDPDVFFWEKVEDWTFGDKLMAGRLIPAFEDEYTGTATMPRLHTSFLFFPDPQVLSRHVAALQGRYFEFAPFRPVMAPVGDSMVRWDTGAALYGVVATHVFTSEQMGAFDHLFCGTHADLVVGSLKNARFNEIHNAVKAGNRDFKGMWREQDEYFAQRPIKKIAMRSK